MISFVVSRVTGLSVVIKVDMDRNRISADENIQNLETSVQVVTAKTVFTTSNVSIEFELNAHKYN